MPVLAQAEECDVERWDAFVVERHCAEQLGHVALGRFGRWKLAADAMHTIVGDRRRAQKRLRDQPVARIGIIGRDAAFVPKPPIDVRRVVEERSEQLVGSSRRVPACERDMGEPTRCLRLGDQCDEQVRGGVGGRLGCCVDRDPSHARRDAR